MKSISFADIENEALFEGEQEIIFNLNSTFKIHSVDFDKTLNLWIVQLNTTDDGSEKLREYLIVAKQEIEECSPMIYFGCLLLNQLGQVDQAKKYFEMLLKSLPSDHPDIDSVYNNIGNVHGKRDELNLALKNYEFGYEIRRKRLPPNYLRIAGSLHNIGGIHQRKRNYDLALDYYQQSLKIFERNYPDDHLKKAMTIQNIGLVYSDKNDFDTALNHLSRALEMFERVLPNQHPDIARCLGSIGDVYKKKGDFSVALDYYHQQLTMQEQCLPFDHPYLSSNLDDIVDTFKKMGQIEKSLDFCRKKLDDQKKRLGENHRCVAQTLKIMGFALSSNDSNKSLQYFEEALSILENCSPPDHQLIVDCLGWMAAINADAKMLEDAVKYQLRILDIQYATLSSDHIDIAFNLCMLGEYYEAMRNTSEAMRNTSEALRCYNQSLSIYQANYSEDHEDVKEVEAKIKQLKKLK